ncbi:MAG: bifunctional metallophosphatase/5'-nucleotidase [Lachnospiraceae bacterium]|nr:bifunctional metallophosphatase/5'-nucleotidase [Lachnospiraceae bacterium]
MKQQRHNNIKETIIKKKILGCLFAAIMIFMCGCSAQIEVDPESGAVSVNGVPLETYIDTAKDMGLLSVSVNGTDVLSGIDSDTTSEAGPTGNIVILHTNDVHCGVDNNLGYAGLAAYKKEMEDEGNAVFLVDDGDEIQGGVIGTLTRGGAIIDIMNEVGYGMATIGNHDFDYGTDRLLELTKQADYPYVCCNFVDLRTGDEVFDPYRIVEIGGRKIAFVGVDTPTTITSTAPAYFEDKNGRFIYGFLQGSDGSRLYNAIQNAVDDARNEGADYCILLAHLGIDEADSPYTSYEVIANTTGIDVIFDGHSHSIVESEEVKNKDGETVLLTQAGYQLNAIGKLTIDAEGNLKSELIQDYDKRDDDITALIAKERAAFEDQLEEVIATSDFDMVAATEDNQTWLVRNGETNMADFVADAYRFAAGTEIAFVNGGGVRNNIKAGNITYGDLLGVNPFSNEVVARYVSGQELADALEYSVSFAPDDFGGFLQVSGITFDVDMSKNARVKLDDSRMFEGFDSDERRVKNIMINGEPLDPDRKYQVASIGFILFNKGNGYTMFNGEKIELDRYIEDITALKEYLASMDGRMSEDYKDQKGQDRMHFISQ